MGNNVTKLRGKHEMTLTALAAEIGVTKQALSLVETGKVRLSGKMANKIAECLSENVFEVLGTDALVYPPETAQDKEILINIIKEYRG